jgi:hypothetical protein
MQLTSTDIVRAMKDNLVSLQSPARSSSAVSNQPSSNFKIEVRALKLGETDWYTTRPLSQRATG